MTYESIIVKKGFCTIKPIIPKNYSTFNTKFAPADGVQIIKKSLFMNEIIDNEIANFYATDIDIDVQDSEDEGGLYPYDPTKEDIDVREDAQSVYELVIRKWDRGLVKIDPEFQRNFVWKTREMSQFIESIILNFPIPPLYLNQNVKGELIVIDGRQRLTTLRKFLKNEFKLEGLQVLKYLNGKNFDDLREVGNGFQAKIENKKMLVYLTDSPHTPPY